MDRGWEMRLATGTGERLIALTFSPANLFSFQIASRCIDKNCVNKTRELLESFAALPLVKELRGQNSVGSK